MFRTTSLEYSYCQLLRFLMYVYCFNVSLKLQLDPVAFRSWVWDLKCQQRGCSQCTTAAIGSSGCGSCFQELLLFIFHKASRKEAVWEIGQCKKEMVSANLSSSLVNIVRGKLIVYDTNYFMMYRETFFPMIYIKMQWLAWCNNLAFSVFSIV